MNFTIPSSQEPLQTTLRRAGYAPEGRDERSGEFAYMRRFTSAPYPRFHLFVTSVKENSVLLSIHLDQKRPSYQGTSAHGGEYDGPVVKQEAQRVASIASS